MNYNAWDLSRAFISIHALSLYILVSEEEARAAYQWMLDKGRLFILAQIHQLDLTDISSSKSMVRM